MSRPVRHLTTPSRAPSSRRLGSEPAAPPRAPRPRPGPAPLPAVHGSASVRVQPQPALARRALALWAIQTNGTEFQSRCSSTSSPLSYFTSAPAPPRRTFSAPPRPPPTLLRAVPPMHNSRFTIRSSHPGGAAGGLAQPCPALPWPCRPAGVGLSLCARDRSDHPPLQLQCRPAVRMGPEGTAMAPH